MLFPINDHHYSYFSSLSLTGQPRFIGLWNRLFPSLSPPVCRPPSGQFFFNILLDHPGMICFGLLIMSTNIIVYSIIIIIKKNTILTTTQLLCFTNNCNFMAVHFYFTSHVVALLSTNNYLSIDLMYRNFNLSINIMIIAWFCVVNDTNNTNCKISIGRL